MSAFSGVRRSEVAARAGHRCEYCRLPTRGQVATFPIDHIVPKSAGGPNDATNLALTCPHCNAHKWTDTVALDTDTGLATRFFHPRQDRWEEHFLWSPDGSGALVGRTPTGRVTVAGLRINDANMVSLRLLLADVDFFPDVRA